MAHPHDLSRLLQQVQPKMPENRIVMLSVNDHITLLAANIYAGEVTGGEFTDEELRAKATRAVNAGRIFAEVLMAAMQQGMKQ